MTCAFLFLYSDERDAPGILKCNELDVTWKFSARSDQINQFSTTSRDGVLID